MRIFIDPEGLRHAWRHGADACDEIAAARACTAAAAGSGLGDLAACLADAAGGLRGSLDVAAAVVEEHGQGVEGCIEVFVATDGRTAGRFHGLDR